MKKRATNEPEMMDEEERSIYTGDYCLSCTSCMASCPVMAATQSYRGPKLMAPAHGRMHFAEHDTEISLDLCTNCKLCDVACPSGVAVSTLNMLQRGAYYRTHPHTRLQEMLAHPEKYAQKVSELPLGTRLARLGSYVARVSGHMRRVGLAERRMFPVYAPRPFHEIFAEIRQPRSRKKVVFFPGCMVDYFEPDIGLAFLTIMNKNGYEVLLDKAFHCCGSPLIGQGYLDEAREKARENVSRILVWKKKGIPVIAACTSCSWTLRREYAELFGERRMQTAGENVCDAFEFLERLAARGELSQDFIAAGKGHRYLYHAPCHLRVAGIGLPAVNVLRLLPDTSIEPANAGCCGMAGGFGCSAEHYELSMRIGEKLFQRIREFLKAGKGEVLSECPSCRWQIYDGTGVRARHPLQVLAAAYQQD